MTLTTIQVTLNEQQATVLRFIANPDRPIAFTSLLKLLATVDLHMALDTYYARWDEGEPTKLIDVAREFRVNYGSLRQLKLQRDKDRSNTHSDAGTAPACPER